MTGVVVGVIYGLVAIMLPKTSLLVGMIASPDFGVREILETVWAIIASWYSVNIVFARLILVLGVGLAGLQGGLLTYWYYRQRRIEGVGKSSLGMMIGAVGASCASCGSFILGSLLGLTASGVVLSYLPYGGLELGMMGILILVWSVMATINKIRSPLAC